MQNIKVGDSVKSFISGSPKMTVTSIIDSSSVECSWFNSDKELKLAVFKIDSLKRTGLNIDLSELS